MSYAIHYPRLRHTFVAIQSAQRQADRLPDGANKRRLVEHLEAAEQAASDLDAELLQHTVLDAEEAALSEPFCACGHVVSGCDGSRTGCRRRALNREAAQ